MKVLLVALCGILLLTGCATAQPEPTATPRPVASAPAPEDSYPAPDPDYMDAVIAKLGPVPPGDTYTSDQEAAARAAAADTKWAWIAQHYPDLVRPQASVVHVADEGDYVASIAPCFEALDVPVTYTYGNRGYGSDSSDPDDVVNQYRCEVEYPGRPQPPFTAAQVPYVYDYFVQFKAPCITGLGYELSAPATPPTKDEFVANWPRPGYNPGAANVYDAELAAVELACPNFPEGMR
jgi:hypothetical protein